MDNSGTSGSRSIVSLPGYFEEGYILIADDVGNMRKTVKNMLRSIGVKNTKEASDGVFALRALRENPNCLFVLMDWNMPRMPGIQAAREIRADEQLQDIPIVMITVETTMDQVAEAGEIGVSGYIIKPFEAKTLGAKILSVLEGRTHPPEYVKLIKAGEVLAGQGRYDMALEVFMESSKLNNSARVLVNIGETYREMGDDEKASEYYRRAAKLNPMYLKAHVEAANLHLRTGDEDDALDALEKSVKISPRNSGRQMSLGKIYLKRGDDGEAEAAFGEAAKLEPEKVHEIAELFLAAGKAKQAEKFFRSSLEADSGNITIYNRLGIALRKQGKWKEAVKEYDHALDAAPKDAAIHFNMGMAFLEGGKKEKALDCFRQALNIDPGLKEAKVEMEKLQSSYYGYP